GSYLGGSGRDHAYAIAADDHGNAYVAGETNSSTFVGNLNPGVQPAYGGGVDDAFVAMISIDGVAPGGGNGGGGTTGGTGGGLPASGRFKVDMAGGAVEVNGTPQAYLFFIESPVRPGQPDTPFTLVAQDPDGQSVLNTVVHLN